MQFSASEQTPRKRQINWIGVILLNIFVAQTVFNVVKRLQKQPYDQRAINKRYLNPLMLKIAGRGAFPQAIIEHVGRKSGRSYTTPVAVMPITHGFVVPLPYGTDVDWCRNIVAAGNCMLQWHGKTYNLVEPEVVAASSIISELSSTRQAVFRMLKVEYVLKLQLSTSTADYKSIS